MERENDTADLIELGIASVETHGTVGLEDDVLFGQDIAGLSDQ